MQFDLINEYFYRLALVERIENTFYNCLDMIIMSIFFAMKFEKMINIELIIFDCLDDILIDLRSSRENIKREESNIKNREYIWIEDFSNRRRDNWRNNCRDNSVQWRLVIYFLQIFYQLIENWDISLTNFDCHSLKFILKNVIQLID